MESTVDRVFNTPELLEHIFLMADMRTVFCTMRVCRMWHKFITESSAVQKHMFLQPDPSCKTVQINPLLHEFFPQWFQCPKSDKQRQVERAEFSSLPLIHDSGNTGFKYEKASWRRMFPRQPPVHSMMCCTDVGMRGGNTLILSTVFKGEPNELPNSPHKGEKKNSSPNRPLEMETLYRLVTSGPADAKEWLFIWDGLNSHGLVFPRLGPRRFVADIEEMLASELNKTGVIMFRGRVKQCTLRGPWGFGEEYRLHMPTNSGREEELLTRYIDSRSFQDEEDLEQESEEESDEEG